MRSLTAAGAIAAASLLVSGCAGPASEAVGADERLRIVATTTQLADIASEVVGAEAQVTSLLQPGESAHAFDPGPRALAALARADLLIVNGAGLEAWLDSTVEASGFQGRLVDTSAGIDLLAAEDDPHEGHSHAEAADEAADEPDARDHEGHDHEDVDPHVWTDPANATLQAEAIRDAVAAADPGTDIDASADAYLARLAELEQWMRGSIEQVPAEERLVVTTHDTLGYLERAFDVQVIGTVLPSLDDGADASAAHIDELVVEIRATGARVVFSENAIDPQLAATIAREAGVELRHGDDALAADALGPEGTPTATYVGAMIHTTTALVTAWGAEPLTLPGSLA